MSLKHRSSYYGGRHARKKTRKNIAVGPKNFKEKHEDTIYIQRQPVRVYMMNQQPQYQTRRYSKKPPPKPKRLYLEKEWSSSPSPPDSPTVVDGFELVPPIGPKERPPRPPPPKVKTLPIAIPNGDTNSNNIRNRASPVRGTENLMSERAAPPNMKPPPLPKPRLKAKDSTSDVSVEELKSKLKSVQSMSPEACSVGSAMLKLTPPKSVTKKSPPPSAQRVAQAKLQPLLPPTAKPRKTKTETSISQPDKQTPLSNGIDGESGGRLAMQPIAGKKNDMVKSVDDVLLHKPTKPLPKLPAPVPRARMKSEDGIISTQPLKPTTPSHPLPIPKSRNGNGSKDQVTMVASSKHDDEESAKTPLRPVPRARVISKESKEQALRNNLVKRVGGDASIELSKPPVPRKRVNKESWTETPTKESPSPLSQPAIPMPRSPRPAASPAKRGSARLSGCSPYADRTGRSKRKKGGGIRAPLWRAPPPPDFTPPTTPRHTPKRSPKPQPPSIAHLPSTPPSSRRSFNLPPFQQSPMLPSMEETSPSFFVMPSNTADPANEKPIELAKSPVPHPRASAEIQFEENLFENKSIKKKRRLPSGQNALPLNIVQELQSNFRMQARR